MRYGFGGLAAPLVGLAGASSILPLGLVTVTAILLATVALAVLSRHPRRTEEPTTASTPIPAP